MQTLVLFALLASGAAADSNNAGVTPVQKVLTMLNGMMEKNKRQKHDEQVQFATYKQFCDNMEVEKTKAIEQADVTIEKLHADIANYKEEAKNLANAIIEDDALISARQGDQRAAKKDRDRNHRAYQARRRDYGESVEALEHAIEEEESHIHDVAQASFAQVKTKNPPSANAYEAHGGGIVETLENLDQKFIGKKEQNENAEKNSVHAFDMIMQDLKAQIDETTSAKEDKQKKRAERLQGMADAKGDLADTENTRKEDKAYLADLRSTCEIKSSDFENRQKLRAEEIEAIEKAIGLISGESVSGAADKHLPSLLQTASSLAQMRANSAPQTQAAARFLQSQAQKFNSRVLSTLATSIQAGDPFVKVKQMVKDLIIKLMEEASEEAEHKGWCDTELSTNEQTRKEKSDEVETLHAELEELDASIAKLTEDITELSNDVAELDKAVQKATEIRQAEKAKNTETIADAKAALKAVGQALNILREFYAKAAEMTSLLQVRQAPPDVFDSPYQGSSESGGVVGMLEVIESDFARLEADTKTEETTSQSEYDKFMDDSLVDKASKTTDIEHKTSKKSKKGSTRTSKQEDLAGTQKELAAAMAYFEKLKPSCVESGVSYEDRVQRRKDEIQSLKEALNILDGQDIA